MLKNTSKPFLGFLQATGLVCYLSLIAIFFYSVQSLDTNNTAEFMAPIIMLLLFIISAVLTPLIVLGRAGILFLEKRYVEAVTLIAWTLGWGVLYLLAIIAITFAI